MQKRNLFLVTVCLVLALFLPGGRMLAQGKNPLLAQLFEAYYQEKLKQDPIEATFIGDHRYDDQLPNDISVPLLQEEYNFDRDYLQRLNGFNREQLSIADKISYDVLKQLLTVDLESLPLHLEYIPINQFGSLPLLIGQLGSGASGQPFNTVSDYERWLGRVKAFQPWTDTAISNMRKGIRTGFVLPKVLVSRIIPQMESLAEKDSSKSVFYGPLRRFPVSFTAAEKDQLTNEYVETINKVLLPCYERLVVFFKEEYLPHARETAGIEAVPGGAAIYQHKIRYWTTMNKTPEEIYQLGLKEVARITAEMETAKQKAGFKGTLQELFTFLRTDKRFMPFKTADEVLQAYRDVLQKVEPHLDAFFDIKPKAKFEIRRVEAFREAGQNGPSYQFGSLDGSRPGIFYVPVPDASKVNVTFFPMEATFLHEAIPGHHYQISLQQEDTALPSFRRTPSFSGFTEGWALYVESLGKQLGCYTDPYQEIGALSSEIHRAIRLVTDVGIHTGKMTEQQAIDYMTAHESISEEDARKAAERYMAMPGQALSYKIGGLEIEALRDKCMSVLGSKFDIRKFHDAVLTQGDMPLLVLDNYINEWLAQQQR